MGDPSAEGKVADEKKDVLDESTCLAGDAPDTDENPFAALQALKDKLQDKG